MFTVDIYKTVSGDTWDLISYKVYGFEMYINELMSANTKYRKVLVFNEGIEIICPDIMNKPSTTPPWTVGEVYEV